VLIYPPELGFDFRFHARYSVIIRRKDLRKGGDALSIAVRVSLEHDPKAPTYIVRQVRVPGIEHDPEGQLMVDGSFILGVGQFRVDWLMRDTNERVCARFWDVTNRIKGKDTILDAAVPRDLIQPIDPTPFQQLTANERPPGPPLHVKIIVNFAPEDPEKITLDQRDSESLAFILRAILQEPKITTFSVIACSLRSQQILYTSGKTPDVDLTALPAALAQVNLGTVDAKTLAPGNSEADFLKTFLTEEIKDADYDALIFVGPKYPHKLSISQSSMDALKASSRPLFYLNYERVSNSYPWDDAIGHVVKTLHGREYHISQPRDLFSAMSDVASRIGPPRRPNDYSAFLP
jgi:hypothetical protein